MNGAGWKAKCPFYGRSITRAFGMNHDELGNQCAITLDAHAPCTMELLRMEPDAAQCPLLLQAEVTRAVFARTLLARASTQEPKQ
jgi:hypothetical protein